MPAKALRIGDVLDIDGRRAVLIGRYGYNPRALYREGTAARHYAPNPDADGKPTHTVGRTTPHGWQTDTQALGWHGQWLDTGEVTTFLNRELAANRLGERPYPVMGAYADTCDADMLT